MLTAQFTEHCSCELWSPLYFCLPLPPSLEIGWPLLLCLGLSARGTAGCTEITRGRFSRNVGLTTPASAHCCLESSILPAAAAASTGASSSPLLAFQALILGPEPAAPRCVVQRCSSRTVAFLPRRCKKNLLWAAEQASVAQAWVVLERLKASFQKDQSILGSA